MSGCDGFDTGGLTASEQVGRTSSSSSPSSSVMGRQRGSGLSAFLFLELVQGAAAGWLCKAGSFFLEPVGEESKELIFTEIKRH